MLNYPVKTQAEMNPRKKFWGLFRRRECLVPTWQGLLLFTLLGVTLMVTAALKVHPFLAVTESVPAEVLVVEGWAPDYVMDEAKVEFERHHYRKLYVTVGPRGFGAPLSKYKTDAEFGAAILIRKGMSEGVIEAVPSAPVRHDRTYFSAVAVKNRMLQHAESGTSITVITLGTHARRSRLLFQKAFGEGSRIGIISIEDRDYDPERWWKSSAGIRTVLYEMIAYIYAVVIFPLSEP